MHDLNLIKSRISCVDVAQRCGLPILKPGDRCVSPLRPNASNPTSFVCDDDFWYDFGDARGGDVIDLLAELKYDGDRGKAIRELATITGVPDNNPRPDGWYTYTQNLCNQIAYWQTQLTRDDYDYLHSRGLTDETITNLKIGRTEDGRLSIPYLKNGYVAYYCTRHLPGGAYPDSKYRKQKRDDFNEHIVWGLDTLNRDSDTLVIAEGAFDAISFYQSGYAVLSAITGFFSRDQISTVISAARNFRRVFIVYDDDSATSNAGERFTVRTAELLTKHRIPFVVGTVPPPYHDISEYYAAGGNLANIINTAEDGRIYIASRFRDFSELERYIYTLARHTKRTDLETIFAALRRTTTFDLKALDALFKSATTAPPENIVVDEILDRYRLIYIPDIGFYEYENGVWVMRPEEYIGSYIDRAYGEFTTYNRVRATTGLLKIRALRHDVEFNKRPVWNFINGTLELETGVFRDPDPNDYCSVQMTYPYNPDATYHKWSRFIEDVTAGDAKSQEILQFIPGYALMSDCRFEKIFVLTGEGGNGKSRYLEILEQLIGKQNVSHLSPRDLLKDFKLIQLKDSILNIAREIRSDVAETEELLKSLSSGEALMACYKHKNYVDFVPRAKQVVALNGQLSSGDTSDGLARRLIILDFKVSFVENPDPNNPYQREINVNILDELMEEVQSGGIFNWAYEGYKLLQTVGYFTETADQAELIQEFKRSSNPILVFWEDRVHDYSDSATFTNTEIYRDYQQWCVDNGERSVSSNVFHREFKRVSKRDFEPYRTNKERGYKRKP